MKRRLFTILSALSLLLFVAVVVLWVRSYRVHDVIVPAAESQYQVSSIGGKLWLFDHEPQRRSGDFPILFRHVGRYAMTSMESESASARIELVESARDVLAVEDYFHATVSLLKAGIEERRNKLPEAEQAVHRARERRTRAWVRWQAAKAPSKGNSRLGFRWYAGDGKSPRFAAIPYWCSILLAVPPAAQLLRYRRAKQCARRGLCPSCGYDLRATPARCPECGTAPAALPLNNSQISY